MNATAIPTAPRPQIDLIDGEWVAAEEKLAATLDDPNTGEFRQHQVATSEAAVDRAIAAAHALHKSGEWDRSDVPTRQALLDLIAAGLDERAGDVAFEDAMSTGYPVHRSRQIADWLGPRVRSAGTQLAKIGLEQELDGDGRPVRILHRALGPAAVLAPWNAPTFVATAKVASALAAGCPVILKPSEWGTGGCQVLTEIVERSIAQLGLPSAILQLVHGAAAVGSQMVSDSRIRAVSFTGGGVGGKAVATSAAAHFAALQLELGGHNPGIVLDDADITLTADALIDGMTKLNGQWCEGPGKILVMRSRHDELVDALLARLAKVRIGSCLDPEVDLGPLSHAAHRENLSRRINDLVVRGGMALTASTLPEADGWFFAPTVVVGSRSEDSLAEFFGPAISLHVVDTVEEAIAAADGPETGLGGFVFSQDVNRALEIASHIRAGEVRINGCRMADLAKGSEQSFWNAAGMGGHGPTDMVRFFQGRQVIGLDDAALPI